MNNLISCVIIIPSYNELLALPQLLLELKMNLSESDAILVMDDSSTEISKKLEYKCRRVFEDNPAALLFNSSGAKSGRGAAVRRGMKIALQEYPNFRYILECDADGSHRAENIIKIKNMSENCDLLIGSRYLPESQIIGWPISRRIFSQLINKIIPLLLQIKVKDLTNGLRRYSKEAVLEILDHDQRNHGFIYLAEQASIINRNSMRIHETPITFVDRRLGESTVTFDELTKSVIGILRMINWRK